MSARWTRRGFLALSGAGAVAIGVGACSSDDDGAGSGEDDDSTSGSGVAGPASGEAVADGDVPTREAIFGWISEVFAQGVRRPGYPADVWAEEWVADRFREIGLDDVRLEPVDVTRWEPLAGPCGSSRAEWA